MLTLTESARVVVRGILTSDGAPEDAGLHIEVAPGRGGGQPAYAVTAVDGPGLLDRVVLHEGVALYLGPVAAAELDDKVLDVVVHADGSAEFTVREHRAPAAAS